MSPLKLLATDENQTSMQQIKGITRWGLVINILLSIVKFILGFVGSSFSLIADAVHSLSDMSTDFAILFGVKFWTKPADDDHPYGHKRIETIVAAFIGVFLVFVGLGIGGEAVIKIHSQEVSHPGWIAFWGAVLSIVLKEILYHWTIIVGRRVKSPAVVANAWHHRTDAFSSLIVAIAVALAVVLPQWYILDHIGAIIVAIFIIKVAWGILADALGELTDGGVADGTADKIKELILTIEGVNSTHAIRTRKMSDELFVDLHIQVDGKMTVHAGHEISGKVKHLLLKSDLDIVDVVVHLEPDKG